MAARIPHGPLQEDIMNSAISCLGNAIWFLCGGILMGLVWWIYGVLCFISIVGIP